MTGAEVDAFLKDKGLWQGPVLLRALKGGYQNEVLDVTTGSLRLVLKRFMPATMGTLFPNLPADEARALEILGPLGVAPRLLGYWPDQALMAYAFVEGAQWDTGVADVARLLQKLIQSPMARVACWMLSKRWRWMHGSISVRITRSTIPFCCGQCGVMNSCLRP